MLRVSGMVIAAVTVALLSACTSGSGFSDLDREATAADVLPSDLPADALPNHSPDTVRLVGELDGVAYYLTRNDDAMVEICVIAYRSGDDWLGGCGGPNGGFGVSGSGLDIVVAPDGSPELDDGTLVGANIVVR